MSDERFQTDDGQTDDGLTRVSTLPSGLRVATATMPGVETVALGAWIGAGTRHETDEVNGVAHLLEHMAFKGTTTRSARRIAEEIEEVGGSLNAYTGREVTAYHARVLKEDTGLGLALIADLLQNSVFDPEELERERGVILQEIAQANDTPDDVVHDHLQALCFPGAALGLPVLGTEASVAALPREAILAFVARNYRAGTMVVAAAGAVDHDAIVERVEALFASVPPGAGPSDPTPAWGGGEHRGEDDLEQVHLTLAFPGVSHHDPDWYAAQILSMAAGGGMSSRLFQDLREARGLCYSTYTWAAGYGDCGTFGFYAGTGPDQLAELAGLTCDALRALAEGGVTEPELRRARAQLVAGVLMGQESPAGRAEALGHQLLVHGRPIPPAETIARLRAVTADDVARIARRLFGGRPALAALGPLRDLPAWDALVDRLAARPALAAA